MKDIICPNCGTAFHVDESTYATILSQIRNKEFNEELTRRISEIRTQLKSQEEADKLRSERDFDSRLNKKEKEIGDLKNKLTELQAIISGFDARKETELISLKALHNQQLYEAKNEVTLKLQKKEQEIIELKAELKNEKLSSENKVRQLNEQHKLQIEDKQGEIERLRDFKLRLSTKMVGETLEQHCSIQFSQAQSMGLYPCAVFEKDNIAIDGSKGDFIFRDFIDENEYISIMFEMKNEVDTTQTKHKNEDFLDKLNKDRSRKGCEYAVLVSMLEQGNELYDSGIVDKSHKYPKMLVIRPQFFLPVLRLLTEGSRKGYLERQRLITELEIAKAESLDFSRFQEKLDRVKNALNKNYTDAHKKFIAATEGIDKAIEGLEKQIKILRDVKANFEASDQKLLKASELGEDDLTIKKLTHGNPTVRKMIEEAE